MKKMTSIAMAFAAVAAVAGSVAQAADRTGRQAGPGRFNFERADADSSGDVTFEEFAAAMDQTLAKADADGDGKFTVAEIADAIQRARMERMARRMIARFDANGDGVLTKDEIEAGQKKRFDQIDANGDGKIEKTEMPVRKKAN
jgi:Ca2+-binding EF-hand superfamily protein